MIKQIGLNSVWILVARVAALTLSLVFVAIIARNLGVKIFGQYAILASMVYIGNIFTTFGTDGLLVRELAPLRSVTSMVSIAFWTQVCLCVAWCVIVVAIALFSNFPPDFRIALVLYNLSLMPLAFYSVGTSVIRAFERMDLYFVLNLCAAALQVLGATFIKDPSTGLVLLSFWLLVVQLIVMGIALWMCHAAIPDFSLSARVGFRDIAGLLKAGWRVALIPPLGLLLQRLNIFILTAISGEIAVGLFSATARLVEGLKLGHFSVLNALMPQLSHPTTNERRKVYNFSLFALLSWSMILIVGILFLADPVVAFVFGPSFSLSAEALRITVFVLMPYTVSSYLAVSMIMQGQEAAVLQAHWISLAGTLLLYFFLIRQYGLLGAAWGTVGSETLLAFLLVIAKYRLSTLRADAIQHS